MVIGVDGSANVGYLRTGSVDLVKDSSNGVEGRVHKACRIEIECLEVMTLCLMSAVPKEGGRIGAPTRPSLSLSLLAALVSAQPGRQAERNPVEPQGLAQSQLQAAVSM